MSHTIVWDRQLCEELVVGIVPDIDGDQSDDLVIAAGDVCPGGVSSVQAVSLRSGQVLWTAGQAVRAISEVGVVRDMDRDGNADISVVSTSGRLLILSAASGAVIGDEYPGRSRGFVAAGAPIAINASGVQEEQGYLIRGAMLPGVIGAYSTPAVLFMDSTLQQCRSVHLGDENLSGFGRSISVLPDLDGDGIEEFTTGQYGRVGPDGSGAGAVSVVSTSSGVVLQSYPRDVASFGHSVVYLGERFGGRQAIAVGAPLASPHGMDSAGSVHIVAVDNGEDLTDPIMGWNPYLQLGASAVWSGDDIGGILLLPCAGAAGAEHGGVLFFRDDAVARALDEPQYISAPIASDQILLVAERQRYRLKEVPLVFVSKKPPCIGGGQSGECRQRVVSTVVRVL